MLMDAESSLHEKLTAEYDRIKGLDAENARLKELNTKVNDGYEALWEIIREQRKLITKLCDVLDRCDPIHISIQEVADLIREGRENAK